MAKRVYLTMTANEQSWGATNPNYGVHEYIAPDTVAVQAFPDPGYYFIEWEGDVADTSANPTTILMEEDEVVSAVFGEDAETNTGDSFSQNRLSDSANPLLQPHVESFSGYGDVADTGFAYYSPAQLLRGPQVPANPYYDHDGNPATEEMLMYDYTAGFLENIGTGLFVGGARGSIAVWNSKTLAEKLLWIQEYEP